MSKPSPVWIVAERWPRPVTAVLAWVLIVEITVLLLGAWHTGISYDEPYHVERLATWFSNGQFLLPDDLNAHGEVGAWVDDRYVYAPVTMLLAHGVASLLGVETWGQVSLTPTAFVVRHVFVVAIALVGVFATALLARLVTRSWEWALVAAATVLSVPFFSGLAMGNLKDGPVATGYTLFTLGLVLVLRSRRRVHLVLGVLLQGLGAVLTVGTRPGMWPALVAGAAASVILLWWCSPGSGHLGGRSRWFGTGCVVLPALAAWALLAAVHPAVFAGLDWLMGAVSGSGNYRGRTASRAQLIGAALFCIPTGLLMFTCGALAVALCRVKVARSVLALGPLTLVLLQGMFLPVLTIVTASFVQGIRQVLFVVPAWSVLLVALLAAMTARVEEKRGGAEALSSTRRMTFVPAALCLALIAPVAAQVLAFPHGHAVMPGAAMVTGLQGRDYWQMSVREVAGEVPTGRFVVCSPFRDAEGNTVRHSSDNGRSAFERGRDCRTDYLSPFAPYTDPAVALDEPVSSVFVGIESEPTLAPNCEVAAEVHRRVPGQSPDLARVLVCDLVLPDYSAGGVTFPRGDIELPELMGGWTGGGDRDGARMAEVRADLGVAWPAREAQVEIALALESEVALEVLVDNEPAFVVPPGRGWVRTTVNRGGGQLREVGLVLTLREAAAGLTHLRQKDVRRGGAGVISGNVNLEELRVGKDAGQVVPDRDVVKWGETG